MNQILNEWFQNVSDIKQERKHPEEREILKLYAVRRGCTDRRIKLNSTRIEFDDIFYEYSVEKHPRNGKITHSRQLLSLARATRESIEMRDARNGKILERSVVEWISGFSGRTKDLSYPVLHLVSVVNRSLSPRTRRIRIECEKHPLSDLSQIETSRRRSSSDLLTGRGGREDVVSNRKGREKNKRGRCSLRVFPFFLYVYMSDIRRNCDLCRDVERMKGSR